MIVVVTAQHRQLLDQKLEIFKIKPHYDLNIMQANQDLYYITAAVLNEIKPVLIKEKPDEGWQAPSRTKLPSDAN